MAPLDSGYVYVAIESPLQPVRDGCGEWRSLKVHRPNPEKGQLNDAIPCQALNMGVEFCRLGGSERNVQLPRYGRGRVLRQIVLLLGTQCSKTVHQIWVLAQYQGVAKFAQSLMN